MPCFTIQRCSVSLENADRDLLEKALRDKGYTVRRNGANLTFSKGQTSGTYSNNRIQMQSSSGSKPNADHIKKAYSEQVIIKRADTMKAKGFRLVKKDDNNYQITRTQNLRVGS